MSWCTIESDPGVFTCLIEKFGVRNIQVEELWSLDAADVARVAPVHGLVFLFKYLREDDTRPTLDAAVETPNLFFAKQVISNACATQALLSILLNAEDVELGDLLSNFKESAMMFPADMRGEAIGNVDDVRIAHNSFARAEPFVSDEKVATDDDDVFHFIAYVPHGGTVYELDGLKAGPIALGAVGDDWLDAARPAIQARMERYSSGEVRFNLMALVRSRLSAAEEAVRGLEAAGSAGDGAELVTARAEVEEQLALRRSWAAENVRRKHNYVPFIVAALKSAAAAGALPEMRNKAKEMAEARRKAERERQSAAQKSSESEAGK